MKALSQFNKQIKTIKRATKRNAPTILTILGIGGFVTSTVMAVKATPKAMEKLEEVEKTIPEGTPKAKEICIKVKAVAPFYGPSALMAITSGFMVGKANSINGDRLAGAITACEVKDQFIKEYRDKVIETVGEKKEQSIRDDIAKDHVQKSNYDDNSVIQAATGTQLFMDSITGIYFRSTRDDIWKALLRFQKSLILEDFMTLNEWYWELAIPNNNNKVGDKIGFNSTTGIELYFSVQEAPNGEPVTVLEYRNPPTYDFCYNHHSDHYWD